jgi:hypothetical protein
VLIILLSVAVVAVVPTSVVAVAQVECAQEHLRASLQVRHSLSQLAQVEPARQAVPITAQI